MQGVSMKALKKVLLFAGITVVLFFIITIVNQLIGLYTHLSRIHSVLAIAVIVPVGLFFLLILYAPIHGFIRHPKMLAVPTETEGEYYDTYISKQYDRLCKNKALQKADYRFEGNSEEERVRHAFKALKRLSDEEIRTNANAVFLTTAISQNGALDGLAVFITLVKMIYNVTAIYENHPPLKRLLYLYVQIASVALIAKSIEDMDLIEEQLEPVLTSIFGGSIVSLIPGGIGIANLIITSMVEGSVNALLTLRVGTITQRYLCAMTAIDKKSLRRGASLEAAAHLSTIIGKNAAFIVKNITRIAKKATLNTFTRRWKKTTE